uniref:Mucin-17 isoform X1 n=1 Tax=Nicotiana sylvestris TaxID=4096 RepID=A0A1U7VYM4_NICSY|nr:PREDICTED: mucin-17 isoform X1 [Nicotiana sylvestris]
MNRSFRDSMISGKNFPISSQHRRGLSLNGASREQHDDNLDLFSKSRRSISVASSDESDAVSVKLGRLSIGSVKQVKSGLEDLIASTEGDKHDYDWLLTPPGTPLVPSSDGGESKPASAAPRGSSLGRSASTTKASRLSVSHSESNTPARPTRSNSVTRPSISSSQYSSYSNKSGSILNTSSASVSSYIRPSTPTSRSSSSARPSTPTSRATVSRPSTPSRARQAPSTPSRTTQSSRPSTPTSRAQIPANLSTPAARSTSRPSTPTRRNITPSLSPASRSSTPAGRSVTNGRPAASVSRPSSPSPQVRRPSQPIVPPDFSLETPPNLRTTLPDRPLSAGRSRPNPSVTTKANAEIPSVANPRRQSSPIVSRGRLTEPSGRGRVLGGGQLNDISDSRRASHVSELSTRKPVKAATDSTGLGRTISKKSLDVAIRHMDIRNGLNGVRPLSGSTLFPHSIRSTNGKNQPSHGSTAPSSTNENASYHYNGNLPENGNYLNRLSENGSEEGKSQYSAKLTDIDIYESSRYDALLLKEDLKNTNWLHSIDDKSDQETLFDNGFESLPEPFSPLQHL